MIPQTDAKGESLMNRIKQLRKAKGITVKDLADYIGIAQSMLTNYENGGTMPRSYEIWEKLAKFLGVSIGYLMGITDVIGPAPRGDGSSYFSFIVLDANSIEEKVIKAEQPVEVEIRTLNEYALLANLSQLPEEEITVLLESVQKLIRTKYAGQLTEFRLSSKGEGE